MKKAWIVSVDMGYGHQRAAYPLKDIAYERIITANSDKIVEPNEKKQWQRFQTSYEFVSRIRSVPLIGKILWKIFDRLQKISPYYPFRDLSKPNLGSIYLHRMIRKNFARSVADYARKKDLPFVSTFFVPALAAAHAELKNVYCVVTDTDINRTWVYEEPKKRKVIYLTPTDHSTRRLIQYGVPPENIYYTGFPLPDENTKTLKHDLAQRMINLDPNKIYISKFHEIIKKELGELKKVKKSDHLLTLTYAVGGAGAQKDVGYNILRSLKNMILAHKIKVNLIAGTRLEVNAYFLRLIDQLELGPELNKHIFILCALDKKSYFEQFNQILKTTDVLWTKPSELCFYTGLGLPIIMSAPLGSHEEFNRDWIMKMNAGFMQEEPMCTEEWFFEWINKGMLAEAAFNGYMKAPKHGTENIKKLIFATDQSKVKLKY